MKKVLIVEDSFYYRKRAEDIIKNLGYEVILAEDGREGVDKYFEKSPDYVIMDICMPELDGLSATKIIKEHDNNAKIIICSSVGKMPFYKKQAIKNGAVNFLSKEFEKNEFIFIIKEVDIICS